MKAVAFSLLVQTNGVDVEESFNQFLTAFGKSYDSTEHSLRLETFKKHLADVEELNKASSDASFGITQFADMTDEEFDVRLGLKYPSDWTPPEVEDIFSDEELAAAPDSKDWREQGAVAPVQDQGHCGSCWAFSTAVNLEGQHFLATGQMVKVAEQELVSCDTKDGACQGGLMTQAFQWITQDRYGELVREDWYPYSSHDGAVAGCGGIDGKYTLCKGSGAGTDAWCTQFCYNAQGKALCTPDLCDCSSTGQHVGVKISGYKSLPNNENQIAAYLAQNGPLSIAVAVPLGRVWQGYTGGIMSASQCPASSPNHGVGLVGFNKAEGYWIVKNSWGTGFGEKGYIRLAFGHNTCNLGHDVSTSTGASLTSLV